MGKKANLTTRTSETRRNNSVSKNHKSKFSQPLSSPADRILFLQKTAGNQAVQRFMKSRSLQAKLRIGTPGDKYEKEADRVADSVIDVQNQPGGQDKGNIKTRTIAEQITPLVQKQGEEVEKQDEKEEEEVQETVQKQEEEEEVQETVQKQEEEEEVQETVQKQEEEEEVQETVQKQEEEEEVQETVQKQEEEEEVQETVQKQEEEEEVQETVQRQEEEEEVQETVQRQEEGGIKGRKKTDNDLHDSLIRTRGSGDKLPEKTRSFMEERFGSDFSDVRVHTGSNAVELSKRLGAQAFTYRNNIYFNEGKYDPGSDKGKRLLAHELTHTIQQGASARIHRSIFLQEERSGETTDLEAELAESEKEAVEAEDPAPAEKTREEAQKEKPGIKEEAAEKPAKEKGKKEEEPVEKKGKKIPKKAVLKEKKEEPKGDVGQYLDQKSEKVCDKASQESGVLAENEQTHDNAEQKLTQTEEAVVPPEEEGQAQSNTEQVEGLDETPAPEPDDRKATETMNTAIEEAVPKKIEELNEFKSKGKARVVGNKVLGKVKEDVDSVNKTYNEIEQAPPAKPPERTPVDLPEKEVAPKTPALDLGKDAVPPLKKEHTDFTEFDKESDSLLEKEGISEEQLDMVDEGELFEANKERKGLKQKVSEEPSKIQEFAKKEVQNVDKDLKAEEKKSREQMEKKRNTGLAKTKNDQKKTKSALEKKREAVTKKINSIYTKAKNSVTLKLQNLEKISLKTFDKGQQKASIEFENEVKRDINAWKRKRYSGIFAGVKWAKDKLFGIDDFPEVKQAFKKGRSNFVAKIDKLIIKITDDNNKVINECKKELSTARKEIKKIVDNLGPELRSTGQKAMAEMNSELDALDKFIDKKKNELAQKLCDKKEEAIKKIDEKIEKMKEEMSGAIAKLGNLILDALLKFFKWALKKAGYSAEQLMGIINKGKAVIKKIVGDPIGFIKNIINAVKSGINNFVKNIKKHLIGGLITWLTGAMGDIGIQLPAKFDLKGILSIVLQILGLTWTSIRQKLVKRLGEKTVSIVEKSVDIVRKIITQGPMALWEMIKEKAAEIKAKVMEGIRNWAIVELVKQGIIKLLSFLNPAGAIVQAILAIYNTIMFFVENWQRIVTFVKTVFDSISDIAMGKISAAAAAVERAMAMTIPIILNFLARLLNLSGIGKAVRKIIMKIRKPIDKVLDKAINFIVKKAKKLIAKVKGKVKKGVAKGKEKIKALIEWWRARKKFKTSDGVAHTIFFRGKKKSAKLMVASNPETIEQFVEANKDGLNKIGKYARANTIINNLKTITRKDVNRKMAGKITRMITELSNIFMKLGGGTIADLPQVANWSGKKNVEKLSTKTSKNGSKSTTADVKGWKLLQKLGLTTKDDKWVKMHLISHRVGGRGDDTKNLIPAPNSVNTGSQVRSFETSVENLVEKRSGDKFNVIWIRSQVTKYHPARTKTPQYGGKTFVEKLIMKAGLYIFKKKGEWKKDKTARISETVSIRKPDSDFSKVKKPSLSYPSSTQFKALDSSLTKSFAKWIRKELQVNSKPFSNFSDFKSRMEKRVPERSWKNLWKLIFIPAISKLLGKNKIQVK